jgi:triosephosphate isomerase
MRLKPLIAGNWKMFGYRAALAEIIAVRDGLAKAALAAEVAIHPPFTLLHEAAELAAGSLLSIGGQDCAASVEGAHTGDVSAAMIADAGGKLVILGHSERRRDHGEDDALIAAKVRTARAAGLHPIICVGETLAERQAGKAAAIVRAQLAGSVPDGEGEVTIAYEPVWAIGTGLTPTAEEIADIHAEARAALAERGRAAVRILYGGSVKPQNAGEILAIEGVDGALVGGASLKAKDFLEIVAAALAR